MVMFMTFIDYGARSNVKQLSKTSLTELEICCDGDVVHSTKLGYKLIT